MPPLRDKGIKSRRYHGLGTPICPEHQMMDPNIQSFAEPLPVPFYEVAFLGVKTSFSNGMVESSDLADMEHVVKMELWFTMARVWAFTMDLGFASVFSWIS